MVTEQMNTNRRSQVTNGWLAALLQVKIYDKPIGLTVILLLNYC